MASLRLVSEFTRASGTVLAEGCIVTVNDSDLELMLSGGFKKKAIETPPVNKMITKKKTARKAKRK